LISSRRLTCERDIDAEPEIPITQRYLEDASAVAAPAQIGASVRRIRCGAIAEGVAALATVGRIIQRRLGEEAPPWRHYRRG